MLVDAIASVVSRLRKDRGGLIEVAQLDVEVVGERLKVLFPEELSRARDVSRIRLLDGEGRSGTPLRFVRLEEFRPGNMFQHERQLPCEVVAVVDAAIAAL